MDKTERRNRTFLGLLLLGIGVFSLLARWIDLGEQTGAFFLLGLAGLLIAWGIATRAAGPLIPGGILAGIGTGVALQSMLRLDGDAEGGIFMLAFAGGWGLIVLLTALFGERTHWWPLIPGVIMLAVGAAALGVPGMTGVFELAGLLWPLLLVALGVWLILRRGVKPA